jgi:imidazole glycerol-phosphate synthase subunit HisH
VIALIDYGAGNLTSVRKALASLGAEFNTPARSSDVVGMAGIVVPGVGHFDATGALDHEWREAIREAVDRGAALLGICLGMQWLFEGSDEAPDLPGFGAFRGRCVRLPSGSSRQAPTGGARLKVPHVGWNSLDQPGASRLMRGVPAGAQVYFTHSYVAPVGAEAAAITTYGVRFASAVERDRIAGVQFHPEKSGDVGLRILSNWLAGLG